MFSCFCALEASSGLSFVFFETRTLRMARGSKRGRKSHIVFHSKLIYQILVYNSCYLNGILCEGNELKYTFKSVRIQLAIFNFSLCQRNGNPNFKINLSKQWNKISRNLIELFPTIFPGFVFSRL